MLVVHVRINDAEIAKPTPVRLCIADARGNHYPPLGRAAEFPIGKNEDVGGRVKLGPDRWFVVDGSCEVPLPAGVPLRVRAAKGPEYHPLDETVTLGPGQMSLRFAIARTIDMRASGWIPGDGRCHFLPPHDALLEAAAEDLDIVNLLVIEQAFPSLDGTAYRTAPHLAAFSGQAPALEAHHCIVAVNTVNVHPVLGRVGLLYSHRPVFPLTFGGEEPDDWSVCDWCDQCHRKGGLVVWVDAFNESVGPPGGEALVAAILGKLDAIEIDAQPRKQAVWPWVYRLWNAGIRLPLLGSSGKADNRTPLGAMRTYADVRDADALSPRYKQWIEAVRAGRTFITNGPLAVETFEPIAGQNWSAARFQGTGGAFAHTSPNFIEEKSVRDPEAVAFLVRAVESTREWIESVGRFDLPKRRENLLDRCSEALAKLEGAA